MAEPFLGEIRVCAFNYAPPGWAFCDGQTLQISINQALYALIGTTYGGDGITTFKLPDLRGRTPVHQGTGYVMGQISGEENHRLLASEVPGHSHVLNGVGAAADDGDPTGRLPARGEEPMYAPPSSLVTMNLASVGAGGGGQGHNNMMPFTVVNHIIAISGIFPSRS